MTEEPFYSSNLKPRAPRQPVPGELLWEFVVGHGRWRCELRTHGEIFALLVLYDVLHRDPEIFQNLRHRVEMVGKKDLYANWLRQLRPIGSKSMIGDWQFDSTSGDPVESAYVYRSL
jgi:hypothetical protein